MPVWVKNIAQLSLIISLIVPQGIAIADICLRPLASSNHPAASDMTKMLQTNPIKSTSSTKKGESIYIILKGYTDQYVAKHSFPGER